MKRAITFKVDGSWLTDFIRKRYWYEGLSYGDSFKLLESILLPQGKVADDYLSETINGVLTGVKRLSGINEFSVDDDNKFSEYSKFLRRTEEKGVLDIDSSQPPEADSPKSKITKVEIDVFDGERHSLPFEYYDGTTEEYIAKPDPSFRSKMGLISPEGYYYGCTFASHTFLAGHLIGRDPVLRSQFNSKYGDCILPEERSLDFLFEKGWIALRNPWGGAPHVDLGNYDTEDDLPQKMIDTLYDYRVSLRNSN